MSNAPALAKRWAVLLVFATLLGESTWTQLTPPQQCLARPEARSPPPLSLSCAGSVNCASMPPLVSLFCLPPTQKGKCFPMAFMSPVPLASYPRAPFQCKA